MDVLSMVLKDDTFVNGESPLPSAPEEVRQVRQTH